MRLPPAIYLSLLTIGPAAAHGPVVVLPDMLWHSWNFDPLVVVPILLALWLYARGVRHLWARAGQARGIAYAPVFSFCGGMTVLLAALVSPLDPLGETLLSAHMAQHGLLVAVAPPLLLLGKPGVVFAWSLPGGWRRPLLRSRVSRTLTNACDALSQPLIAAVLHGLTLWVWHAPSVFDAAVASYSVHVLEHATFFGTALLFWRAILDTSSLRRVSAALGSSFATLMHSGLLGGLITLAPYPLYKWYLGRTDLWGLSPLEDQQLAGLFMWVPMGVVYLASSLVLASRLVVSARANFWLSDLTGANLSGANRVSAALNRTKLNGANLSGVNLENGDLIGTEMHGANVRNAQLRGATLDSADLRGADPTSAAFSTAVLGGANPTGARTRATVFSGTAARGCTGCPPSVRTRE